jgi:hypothetical protein
MEIYLAHKKLLKKVKTNAKEPLVGGGTIVFEIRNDSELTECMICLNEPGFRADGPFWQPETAVYPITGSETSSMSTISADGNPWTELKYRV